MKMIDLMYLELTMEQITVDLTIPPEGIEINLQDLRLHKVFIYLFLLSDLVQHGTSALD